MDSPQAAIPTTAVRGAIQTARSARKACRKSWGNSPMRAFGMLIVLMLLFQPAAGPVFAKKLITNRANVFGNADNRAFVYISRPLPKIDFGDSSIIFNMEFSSNPKKTPGNLGMYWSVSLFDSVAVKTNPAQLEWKTPNRMSYFFRKGKIAQYGL